MSFFNSKKFVPTLALLALFFCKGLFWMFLFPVFQTPDEIRHFDYVAHLALKRHFPLGPNARHPQSYYMEETADLAQLVDFHRLVYRPSQKTRHIIGEGKRASLVTRERLNGTETMVHDFENIYLFAYEPLYYVLNAGIYVAARSMGFNALAGFYLLRLFSLLLSLWALWLVVKILGHLGLGPQLQFFVLALLFLWPQFSMFIISVQPDVLAMFFVILTSFFLVAPAKKHPYILLGILIGLLGLVKFQYFATMLFSVTVVFTLKSILEQKRPDFGILKTIGVSCALASLWMIHNYYYYHAVHPGDMLLNPETDSLAARLGLFFMVIKGITLKSFLAYFGWLDTQVPEFYYGMFAIFLMVALFSFLFVIFREAKKFVSAKTPHRIDEMGYAYLHLFFPLIVFVGLMLVVSIFMSPLVNSQGRLYFPFVVPLVLLFVVVPAETLGKSARIYHWGIILFMAVLHIHSTFIIWNRYYGL